MKFYNGILGFEEFWRGSSATSKTLSWVNMRVPDGTDYVEFMLYDEIPAPDRRGSAHHLCLVVPDADKTVAALNDTTNADHLHASDRDQDRDQPEASGQPLRSRRDARRGDGAEDDRREAGAVIDAPAAPVTRIVVKAQGSRLTAQAKAAVAQMGRTRICRLFPEP